MPRAFEGVRVIASRRAGGGLLVYSISQRQVRLYLRTHDQQIPGNKGTGPRLLLGR